MPESPALACDVPVVLPGPLDNPGTLQVLALCLAFGGIAMTYDLLFGYTGLLNFGQAGFMAVAGYGLASMVATWDQSFWVGIIVGILPGLSATLVIALLTKITA